MAAMTASSRLGEHEDFGKEAMTALWFRNEQLAGYLMGKCPADRFAAFFRNKDCSVLFGAAMLYFTPVVCDEIGIAAAVRLEPCFIVLQTSYEG